MNSKKIQDFIKDARHYLGTPYKYAVPKEEIGAYFDCSSFTQFLGERHGIALERSTLLQAAKNGREVSIDEMRPGDLLFYEGEKGHYDKKFFQGRKICIGHVVIYAGNSMGIHATGRNDSNMVTEENLETIEKHYGLIVMVKRIFE